MSFLSSFFGLNKSERDAAMALAGNGEMAKKAEPKEWRTKWLEMSSCRDWFHFGLKYWEHEEGAVIFAYVPWRTFTLNMPWNAFFEGNGLGESVGFGFSTYQRQSLHFEFYRKTLFLDFPFVNFVHQKTEILDFDRTPVYTETSKHRWWKRGAKKRWSKTEREEAQARIKRKYKTREEAKKKVQQQFPFAYLLKNGEVQHRTATVYVERLTWGRKWWPWCHNVRTFIDISFDGEVGEKSGSYKGGTVGCSYDLKSWETPGECLRRMEGERSF